MTPCTERLKERERMMGTSCMLGKVGFVGSRQWKKVVEVWSFGGVKDVESKASLTLSVEKLQLDVQETERYKGEEDSAHPIASVALEVGKVDCVSPLRQLRPQSGVCQRRSFKPVKGHLGRGWQKGSWSSFGPRGVLFGLSEF